MTGATADSSTKYGNIHLGCHIAAWQPNLPTATQRSINANQVQGDFALAGGQRVLLSGCCGLDHQRPG